MRRSDHFGYDYSAVTQASIDAGRKAGRLDPIPVDPSATIRSFNVEAISTKRVTAVAYTRDNVEGMQLTYADGYVSWCPLEVFDRDYEALDAMSFSHALFSMGQGFKVARAGWNGKGMWICQADGNPSLPASAFWNRHTKEFAESNGGHAEVLPYFIMKTADGKILMGWLASQSDLLATDWMVLA